MTFIRDDSSAEHDAHTSIVDPKSTETFQEKDGQPAVSISISHTSISTSSAAKGYDEAENMAVITDGTNAGWFFKPDQQPSSILTTATSSLMPSTPSASMDDLSPTTAKGSGHAVSPSSNKPPSTLYNTLQSSLAAGIAVSTGRRSWKDINLPSTTPSLHPTHPSPSTMNGAHYHNPYRAPSHTNSRSFIPPPIPGYEFSGGSQAGNMGLMIGRRISDDVPVMAKLHQSRVLLQHEFRIYKRLEIANAKYDPKYPAPLQPSTAKKSDQTELGMHQVPDNVYSENDAKKALYENGSDESERYYNRIVEDFIDLEEEDMSILILERLGSNLLSHTHHRFLGLKDDGLHCPETQPKQALGSPFPDVYTFLVFALKAACVLEALLHINLAHLAICPTALHWMPAKSKEGQMSSDSQRQHASESPRLNQGHMSESASPSQSPQGPATLYNLLENMDLNDTKIRLFDFTHSRVLSHERARAPNNIAEWQIAGYLEYHLQYLAPEQTGRAETWMDHRTDIYGLGTTLFSLLTMQFPNSGQDSVQILQGVLSRDLPPLGQFRPDMPPVIDDILRKMTQKQPSQRYQNAFGFKQDILRCLDALHTHDKIESFELGQHDVSYQFVLPNAIYGRHFEQQLISAAIAQAASAYQQSMHSRLSEPDVEETDDMVSPWMAPQDSDHYIFTDDIVSLPNQASAKIPLSSKTLLRTPRPFDGGKSVHRGTETSDPVIRVIFVSGPSGVGKTVLVRGMAAVARNSGLFAAGAFEAEGSAPYSAILSCIQSVLQQLLAQHTDALASLVVAIRTAFEPNSGIGIICDLIPVLKYFFNGSEMPESKDVPLTQSVARFHALILKLIRVISTHFFMTWLIDDLHYADENSIELLATLVNVNKRLPIVLIITHWDTVDCLVKVKRILGRGGKVGNITSGQRPSGYGVLGAIHRSSLVDDYAVKGTSSTANGSTATAAQAPPTKVARAAGRPLVVRGGGGVRFVRLQNPTLETIQEFLEAVLHREKTDVLSLAKVLHQKSWLTIRQLVLELYRTQTICFNTLKREWEWESCEETLAGVVRQLTGEEYAFLENRFRALDCDTRKTLICASICGPVFTIQDLQLLVHSWTGLKCSKTDGLESDHPVVADDGVLVPELASADNKGCNAMAGLQSAIREGILVYTSVQDRLRFHHGVMRRVALSLLESQEETEELHFEMAKILFNTPRQEFRTAGHVLQCINLIKKTLGDGSDSSEESTPSGHEQPARMCRASNFDMGDPCKVMRLNVKALRALLSLAGEKSQKSGAQDMALAYWNAALSLLPENCWNRGHAERKDNTTVVKESNGEDIDMDDVEAFIPETMLQEVTQDTEPKQLPLYYEALKLHLQCIEAERWRENFDQAMKVCEIVLANVDDPIDRARVYQHQIEISVWAYSSPERATAITIQCLRELGMPKDMIFSPTEEEVRRMYDATHDMLLAHMPELEAEPPKMCHDPRISMMMEVLSVAGVSLYYCNVPFMASGIAQSVRLTCEHGITKDAGRALVSFALTYSTWYDCLDNAYELGRLACKVSTGNRHVKFIFYLTVQQWGEHVALSIPALEESLMAVDLASDRLFHTAGMIHISLMKVLIGRVHLNELMTSTVDQLTKHVEFGPKSHGLEVMQGILQLIKCLKGRTLSSNADTIFDDIDTSEQSSKNNQDTPSRTVTNTTDQRGGREQSAKKEGSSKKKPVPMVHNNSTYQMLQVMAAFIFGHYAYVDEVTDSWHDDSKSIMNFESSWITHAVFTAVGLSLANLLRTETEPAIRSKRLRRLFSIRDRMRLRANKFATNHAAMYYLLEAEIADQGLMPPDVADHGTGHPQGMGVLLLYEKAIHFSTEGNFPLHKFFSYELAAKCHLRHGLVTSARCLMMSACRGYQDWGARGKVQWFNRTYPELFGSASEGENAPSRGLFYRPNEIPDLYHPNLGPTSVAGSSVNSFKGPAPHVNAITPWHAPSPKNIYSPATFGNDAVSAAAAAIAVSCMSTSYQSGGVGSTSASDVSTTVSTANPPSAASSSSLSTMSGPLYSLQNTFLNSPQSPEVDNADLDVLDFSSVIEAMQVIASEIDLDLLLVKSLGVLNQSVGAKQCCVIISKDDELVLAASLGDLGRCMSVIPPMEVEKCSSLFHGVINYVVNTCEPCLLTNAKDDPRFCADAYLKQRTDLKTVLCCPILHKAGLVGVLYMEEFPERAFANKRMLVMNMLVQQLGISITNALLYQSVLQSESKLNGLLENLPCGIALWDASGESCQYINSGWEDMTGFTIEEIMSSEWRVLIHPEELLEHGVAWKERVHTGKPCQWELRYRLKDGTFRWGITRMLPILAASDQNKILQWLSVTIDIDDQRKAVQLKSNFLANMSHELRTPFSGILGMLSLLKDSSGLSHEQFEFVDMAKASCEMLIRIVDDLLNFSKLEADKVTLEYIPMCFEEILGDVCDLLVPLASRKGLELIILVDHTLPVTLIGDPDRMKQILMNLIGNAIKFSTSGSVVIKYWHEVNKRTAVQAQRPTKTVMDLITSQCQNTEYYRRTGIEKLRSEMELEEKDPAAARLGDEVVLHCAVTDQGIGMTPQEQKMLFVSFQQTDNGTTRKYGGTGLGLSICAQLISHMDGKIIVDSEKGKGSTFTFTAKVRSLTDHDREQNPAETARIGECGKVLNTRWDALRSKRVLILSPNKLLRQQIMHTILGAEFMEFDDVTSAVEAHAIGILGEPVGCCSDLSNETARASQSRGVDGPMGSIQEGLSIHGKDSVGAIDNHSPWSLSSASGAGLDKTIRQFDFILVDHVLDSEELDCIYPSPSVAFVLLLAPTTETLRWILPPAEKRLYEEVDDTDTGPVDVGGRGRIRQSNEMECAERAIGQVRSASYMSKIAGPPASASEGTGTKKPSSQLFRRKKISGSQQSLTDSRNRVRTRTESGGTSLSDSRVSNGSFHAHAAHFQVVRMIKPVRRLKLLQIMYNALVLHELKQQRRDQDQDVDEGHESAGGADDMSLELSDGDERREDDDEAQISRQRQESSESVFTSASSSSYGFVSGSSSPSLSFSSSPVTSRRGTAMKRRHSKSDQDEGDEEDEEENETVGKERRETKVAKVKGSSSSSSSSSSASLLSSSGAPSSSSSPKRKTNKGSHQDGVYPKRTRNNDALTLLLTQEERKRCRGINVLVAEDDFVSQVILEKQLSKLGMNVKIASNGQEAVDHWLAAERGYYTIAIFDHHMPIMDGLAATRKIRSLEAESAEGATELSRDRNKGRIPIVGLSADIQLATKEKCINAGMDEYMTKPLLTRGLALLIQRYCCG